MNNKKSTQDEIKIRESIKNKIENFVNEDVGPMKYRVYKHTIRDNISEDNVIEVKAILKELENKIVYYDISHVFTLAHFDQSYGIYNKEKDKEYIHKLIEDINAKNLFSTDALWIELLDKDDNIIKINYNWSRIELYFGNLIVRYAIENKIELPFLDVNKYKHGFLIRLFVAEVNEPRSIFNPSYSEAELDYMKAYINGQDTSNIKERDKSNYKINIEDIDF